MGTYSENSLDDVITRYRGRMLNYLSSGAKTRNSVETKLESLLKRSKRFTESEKESIRTSVISYIEDLNLIDDTSYAEAYVLQQKRVSSPKSPLEVRAFLYRKGISDTTISKALKQYTTEMQLQNIETLISKKNYDSQRLYRYLTSKGYDPYLVRESLDI